MAKQWFIRAWDRADYGYRFLCFRDGAWTMSDDIRDTHLFGTEEEADHYQSVVPPPYRGYGEVIPWTPLAP